MVGVVFNPFLLLVYPPQVSIGARQSSNELLKAVCITGKYIYPTRSQHSFRTNTGTTSPSDVNSDITYQSCPGNTMISIKQRQYSITRYYEIEAMLYSSLSLPSHLLPSPICASSYSDPLRCPNTPQPLSTSLSPQNTHSSPPTFPSPSFLLCAPNSPHLIKRFPSKIPLVLPLPPVSLSTFLNAFGFNPHALSRVLLKNVARPLNLLYEFSDKGVMRANVPDWEVCRIWWRGWGGPRSSGEAERSMEISLPSAEPRKSEDEGREREERRRCIVTGKWPVWKVDLWRRRRPPMDLGSEHRD